MIAPETNTNTAQDENGNWWFQLDDNLLALAAALGAAQNGRNNSNTNSTNTNTNTATGGMDKNVIYGAIGVILLIVVLVIAFKKS